MDGYVLLVEDNEDIREMMSLALQLAGARVVCASNGLEALSILKDRRPPDIILLDLMMPVMDGVEFRRRQQSLQAVADIPVLCLSAKYDARETASALGMDACLPKPFEPDAVADAVRQFCEPEQ